MHLAIFVGWMVLGLFHLTAATAGVQVWLGVGGVAAALVALFAGALPFVGTGLALFGAQAAWGWHWLESALALLGPFFIVAALSSWLEKRRSRNGNQGVAPW